jgi:hypothetical protein
VHVGDAVDGAFLKRLFVIGYWLFEADFTGACEPQTADKIYHQDTKTPSFTKPVFEKGHDAAGETNRRHEDDLITNNE